MLLLKRFRFFSITFRQSSDCTVASSFGSHCHKVTMDSMKGQGGIQMLLTAEQEAQQIVTSARNLKMKRLKQAKDEAEKEASQYRAHLEAEHQKNVSETKDNSGSNCEINARSKPLN
ncbi:hypothetical protein NE237_018797 [Protea cynaroides]|uniref:V-type proton ATPase subunit G n=1 Tax=Protea cynaroides TaxID=273540 RepID=A0A9Q0KAJ5_9MAGN|nr:hypothetical protein NE237_018797 [Protea cynaroides]